MNLSLYILTALKTTPWWVYLLFIYLLIRGLVATKTRAVFLPRIFIIPGIFIALQLSNLFNHESINYGIYFGALCISSWLSWIMTSKIDIQTDKEHWTITIPGSWHLFIQLMSIFVVKYFFGFMHSVYPEIITQYLNLEIAVWGGFTGLFLGKALCFLYKFLSKPSEKTKLTFNNKI